MKRSIQTGASRASIKRKKKNQTTPSLSTKHIISNDSYRAEEDPSSSHVLRMKRNNNDVSKDLIYSWKNCLELSNQHKSEHVFEEIIFPMKALEFFEKYFEKQVFVLKRNMSSFYSEWFSKAEFDELIKKNIIYHNKDMTISKYENGARVNYQENIPSSLESSDDNAYQPASFEFASKMLSDGCSWRILCPQRFKEGIRRILSELEDVFSMAVGSNLYLTPNNSQGFAAHADDIDAFILQLEGRKIWKVYAPNGPETELPRFPSKDFSRENLGQPTFEVCLNPGDLLYLPRGFVHEAMCTKDDEYSLHLTISTGHRNSMADMMELVVQEALQHVIESNTASRASLPRKYTDYMGVCNSEIEGNEQRNEFIKTWGVLWEKFGDTVKDLVDVASDQMAKSFVSQRIPFVKGKIADQIQEDVHRGTSIRACKPEACRVLVEEDSAVLYYKISEVSEFDPLDSSKKLEFDLDSAPIIEAYLRANRWVSIEASFSTNGLGLSDTEKAEVEEEKVAIAKVLLSEGVLERRN